MEVRRVELPSGYWWDIRTRPTWQDICAIGHDGQARLDELLVAMTEAWYFQEAVTLESLARRDESDVAAVVQIIHDDVLPWLDQDSPESMAKGLFAGMLTGQVPDGFFEVQLMAATGWSWHTLQSTPADIVLKMALFLAVSQVKEQGGALQFPAGPSADGATPNTERSGWTDGDEADDQ